MFRFGPGFVEKISDPDEETDADPSVEIFETSECGRFYPNPHSQKSNYDKIKVLR